LISIFRAEVVDDEEGEKVLQENVDVDGGERDLEDLFSRCVLDDIELVRASSSRSLSVNPSPAF
jgi:hypothetical protein